jgi:hypothetical protein
MALAAASGVDAAQNGTAADQTIASGHHRPLIEAMGSVPAKRFDRWNCAHVTTPRWQRTAADYA